MQIVDDRVVRETLNTFLHGQVFVDENFEAAPHLLVIDLFTLSSYLLLMQVYYVHDFCASV